MYLNEDDQLAFMKRVKEIHSMWVDDQAPGIQPVHLVEARRNKHIFAWLVSYTIWLFEGTNTSMPLPQNVPQGLVLAVIAARDEYLREHKSRLSRPFRHRAEMKIFGYEE